MLKGAAGFLLLHADIVSPAMVRREHRHCSGQVDKGALRKQGHTHMSQTAKDAWTYNTVHIPTNFLLAQMLQAHTIL